MQGGLEPLRQRLEAIEGKDVEGGARKDANEVLLMDGPEALLECINAAGVYPVAGLYRFTDFWDEIQRYYEQRVGDETGMSTGWRALDPFYRWGGGIVLVCSYLFVFFVLLRSVMFLVALGVLGGGWRVCVASRDGRSISDPSKPLQMSPPTYINENGL